MDKFRCVMVDSIGFRCELQSNPRYLCWTRRDAGEITKSHVLGH